KSDDTPAGLRRTTRHPRPTRDLYFGCAGQPIGHSLGDGEGRRFAAAPHGPGGLMDRRTFLKSASAASAALAVPKTPRIFAPALPEEAWRPFEVTGRGEVLKPVGTTYVWLPAAIPRDTPFQKTLGNEFKAEGGTAELVKNEKDALAFVSAKFPEGAKPVLTLTCR